MVKVICDICGCEFEPEEDSRIKIGEHKYLYYYLGDCEAETIEDDVCLECIMKMLYDAQGDVICESQEPPKGTVH